MSIRPKKYVGLDADWEGGLSAALAKFEGVEDAEFLKSSRPVDLNRFSTGLFDFSASLETFEHIPEILIPEYMKEISRITNGHFFVSVPNEKGMVFLIKYIMKNMFFGGSDKY